MFQRFSTLDAVSNGRAEVILGRGSFIESFPLFGFDLKQYEQLFNEKLDLFAAVLKRAARHVERHDAAAAEQSERLSENRIRPADDLDRRRRHAAVRHARGALRHADDAGDHRRRPAALHAVRRSLSPRAKEMGKPELPVGVHSHGFVGETDAQARDELFPDYKRMRDKIGAERGWPPLSRAEFEQRDRAWLALRRVARDGRAQDRRHRQGARCRALRP